MVLALAIEHGEKRVILHLILAYQCTLICLKFVYYRYCYFLDQHIFVLMPKMCILLFIASTLCIPAWPLTYQLEAYLHNCTAKCLIESMLMLVLAQTCT
jgi:hypothetical protein